MSLIRSRCLLRACHAGAIFDMQAWCWDEVRDIRALVFALDAHAAGQQEWLQLARQAALRGTVGGGATPPHAYGGWKDVSEAWTAGAGPIGANLSI